MSLLGKKKAFGIKEGKLTLQLLSRQKGKETSFRKESVFAFLRNLVKKPGESWEKGDLRIGRSFTTGLYRRRNAATDKIPQGNFAGEGTHTNEETRDARGLTTKKLSPSNKSNAELSWLEAYTTISRTKCRRLDSNDSDLKQRGSRFPERERTKKQGRAYFWYAHLRSLLS